MDSPPGERKQDSGEADAQDLRAQVLIETLQELKLQDKKDVDCCVICLEAITERCELNPCGHSNFDYNCLLNWLLEKQKCPLCKADAVEVYHGPADDRITSPIKLTRKRKPATSPSRSHLPSSLFLSVRSRVHFHREGPPRGPSHRPCERDETLFKAAIERRAMVYAHRRFSKHIGTNSISRFRELTPVMFNSDPALVSRARMWMRRELHVFPFLSRNDEPPSSSPAAALGRPQPHHHHGRGNIVRLREHNAEYLLEFIVAVLKTVDIRGSAGQAEDMLADYLGRDNAQLFLHELASWLRSPCDRLEDWDRMVQYDPIPAAIARPFVPRRRRNLRRERGPDQSSSLTYQHDAARRFGSVPPQDMPSARFRPGASRVERRRRPDFNARAINGSMDLFEIRRQSSGSI